MNTLIISKDIYTALTLHNSSSGSGSGSGDGSLYSYVGTRVFPIVADEGTNYPFITYQRTGITASRTKCGIYEDTVNFSVNILTQDYLSGLEIGDEVRKAIEKNLTCTIEGCSYSDILLVGANEQYSADGYVQTLNFQVIVNN